MRFSFLGALAACLMASSAADPLLRDNKQSLRGSEFQFASRDAELAAATSGSLVDADASTNTKVSANATVRLIDPTTFLIASNWLLSNVASLVKTANAINVRRMELQRGTFAEAAELLVQETQASLTSMSSAFDEALGDVKLRFLEETADVALATIQTMPDLDVVASAHALLSPPDSALPDPDQTPLTGFVLAEAPGEVGLLDRLLAAWKAASAAKFSPAAVAPLRAELGRLLLDDFDHIKGFRYLGDERTRAARTSAGYAAVDVLSVTAGFGSVMDAGVGAALGSGAARITSPAAVGQGQGRDAVTGQLSRVRSNGQARMRAVRRLISSAKRAIMGPLQKVKDAKQQAADTLQLVESTLESTPVQLLVPKAALDKAGQALASVKDAGEQVSSVIASVKEAALTFQPLATLTSAVKKALPTLSLLPFASLAAFAGSIAEVAGTKSIEASLLLEGARALGVAHERAEADRRLAVFETCRLFQLLRDGVGDLLSKMDGARTSEALDLASTAGLGRLSLSAATRRKITVTVLARLCAVLSPVYHRIGSLFRSGGTCKERVEQQWQLTGAKDALANMQGSLTRDTCVANGHGDDIYDVQLVSNALAAQFEALGYARLGMLEGELGTPAAAGWTIGPVPAFRSALNAAVGWWADQGKAATKADEDDNLRTLVFLRCKNIAGAIAAAEALEKSPAVNPQQKDKDKGKEKDKGKDTGKDKGKGKGTGSPISTRDALKAYLAQLVAPVSDIILIAREPADLAVDTDLPADYALLQYRGGGADYAWVQADADASADADAKADAEADAGGDAAPRRAMTLEDATNYSPLDKRVRGGNTRAIFAFVRRGGSTALADVAIAPFARISKQAGKTDSRTNHFLPALHGSDAAKAGPVDLVAYGAVVPKGCTLMDSVEALDADADAMKAKSIVERGFNWIRRAKKTASLYKHAFSLTCPARSDQSAYERVALSPYEWAPTSGTSLNSRNDVSLPRQLLPFLWLRRRFITPPFNGNEQQLPGCGDDCNSNTRSFIVPRARYDVESRDK